MIISDLFAPDICIICKRPAARLKDFSGFCRFCLSQIPWRTSNLLLSDEEIFFSHEYNNRFPIYYNQTRNLKIYAACDYSRQLRHCLLQFKFHNKSGLAKSFACIITSALRSQNVFFDTVAAVPLHQKRLSDRGYNQAGLLATEIAEIHKCSDLSYLLVRNKYTQRQSEQINKIQRYLNLENAFSLNRNICSEDTKVILKNRKVLLIDDVITTGATIRAAAIPLLAAGADVTAIAVASDHS